MSMTEPAATPAAQAPAGPSRARIITARVLVVLGVVLVVVSLLANFIRREALDRDTFRDTSQQLIANDDIRNQVAATMVDQLYANVDVAGALQQRLPDNLQALAAPLAGLGREAIDRGAQELLARPRVQSLFVDASSLAQAQVKRVLEGDTPRLQTSNGNVVLDLRPLVVQLGDRFGFLGDLDQQLPPTAAQVTILKADNLDTAQSVTQGLKVVANWIWIPAILCWAVALWLVPDRRRREVRAIGIGLIVAGIALLVIRSLAGSYHREGRARDSVPAHSRAVARPPRPRVGGVLRHPAPRRVGAATPAFPDGRDPRRARRNRVRGDSTTGRAGDGRGRPGGRCDSRETARSVAPDARRAG